MGTSPQGAADRIAFKPTGPEKRRLAHEIRKELKSTVKEGQQKKRTRGLLTSTPVVKKGAEATVKHALLPIVGEALENAIPVISAGIGLVAAGVAAYRGKPEVAAVEIKSLPLDIIPVPGLGIVAGVLMERRVEEHNEATHDRVIARTRQIVTDPIYPELSQAHRDILNKVWRKNGRLARRLSRQVEKSKRISDEYAVRESRIKSDISELSSQSSLSRREQKRKDRLQSQLNAVQAEHKNFTRVSDHTRATHDLFVKAGATAQK